MSLLDRQQAFGYSQEDLALLMAPMAATGQEAVGSMGTDTPISALSDKSKLLYTYFKQNFAQVTNPPIDPIREELVMSLVSFIGPRPNILDHEGNARRKRLEVRQPILTNEDLEKIRCIGHFEDRFDTKTHRHHLCRRARRGGHGGCAGRASASARKRPCVGALQHHHPQRPHGRAGPHSDPGAARHRGRASSPDPQGPAHLGRPRRRDGRGARGASFLLSGRLRRGGDQSLSRLRDAGGDGRRPAGEDRGLRGRQALHQVDRQGPAEGDVQDGHLDLSVLLRRADLRRGRPVEGLRRQVLLRHRDDHRGRRPRRRSPRRRRAATATPSATSPVLRSALEVGGEYAYRMRGEAHNWTPETVSLLQHAVRGNARDKYDAYARLLNEQSEQLADDPRPVPHQERRRGRPRARAARRSRVRGLDIVKRFSTGAMSFGSISREAHTTLAIAMNRIGGKSNTGEGGEESDRYKRLPNGDSMRSAIKQVASGRFGVTTEYLVNSDMMQIKMAQGAKPGEGGQLPGHKVDAVIAKVRHSTQGVGLISPPPHHDIYSIEDLKQLVYDLKNVNPQALVSVKLVSEVGVGTVAAGVAKCKSDHVTISGFEGGTGASPLTSIKHAGSPWEIGLAETHQTLVMNGLRARIAVQVDGGVRTGRDVVIGALLGADEFGFATAPLIAAGCIMMRKCHLNTCPVGVATQDPVLRKRFVGQPEHVINFFFFVAEEVRELMAALGYRKFDEMVGQRQMLDKDPGSSRRPRRRGSTSRGCSTSPSPGRPTRSIIRQAQDHQLEKVLDRTFIAEAKEALEHARHVRLDMRIANSDRSAGAMLSGEVARRYGHAGLQGRHDPHQAEGHGGPELRRLPRQGRDAGARRRRQRLCRQGPLGRTHHRLSAQGGHEADAGTVDHRRQHRALWRDRRASAISAAWRASASACATPAPSPWSKARAITAAST